MRLIILTLVLLTSVCISNAQASILNISPEIKLPKDSLQSKYLISSLNKFLIAAQADAQQNKWVYQAQFLETTPLLDELESIDKKDSTAYKPFLLDVSLIGKKQYAIQISYLRIKKETPIIRANIELIAHKIEDKYVFSSPLVYHTKNWKSSTIKNYTIHYQDTVNLRKAVEFQKLTAFYDQKLNIEPKEIHIYLFEDDLVTQKYFGLPYKLDYNGRGTTISWSVELEKQGIHVLNSSNFTEFDPHDLWHNRLRHVISRRKVNHAVDEGIATLYGGSWGLDWQDLFTEFQKQIQFNKHTDWLDLRTQKTNFITDGHKNPTDFMVNALFVKKIENEKGFSAVWELLNAKEEDNYFKTLKKLTGITKNNYNKEVWNLVKKEMKILNGTN
ncbi:S8/S53 family peptidase [Psychroserpens ponticola]|uniref:Uncharacterized protein n=1 Tax=Psychroserpens ponticola TaxID=2932268 RepID=A0ABY7RVB6_9FLAO|nr:hypothetical protein [Psychroserpens ponticola]WCO01044.1 hypothetical protein MUN68_013340 [Psychroserpens ponticola]